MSCRISLSIPQCLLAFLGLYIASVFAVTAKEAKAAKEAYLRDLERRIEHQVEKVAEEVGRKTAEEEAEEKAERKKKTPEDRDHFGFEFEAEEASQFEAFRGGWKPSGSSYQYAGTRSTSGLDSSSRKQSIYTPQTVTLGQKLRTPLEVTKKAKILDLRSMIMLQKTPFVLDSE